MLGTLILWISAVFTFGNKAEAPATTGLEPRSDGWYSAVAPPFVRLAAVIDDDAVDVLAAQTPLRSAPLDLMRPSSASAAALRRRYASRSWRRTGYGTARRSSTRPVRTRAALLLHHRWPVDRLGDGLRGHRASVAQGRGTTRPFCRARRTGTRRTRLSLDVGVDELSRPLARSLSA